MNTQPRAFLFLADGFEITEAMAPADILVRGGIELNIISISDSHTVTSAQRISVNAEFTLDEYPLNDIRTEDIMIFPGGMPGSTNLAACAPLVNRMQRHYAEGGTVAAICAAPAVVLSLLPLEEAVRARGGLKMTCYEGFEPYLTAKGKGRNSSGPASGRRSGRRHHLRQRSRSRRSLRPQDSGTHLRQRRRTENRTGHHAVNTQQRLLKM